MTKGQNISSQEESWMELSARLSSLVGLAKVSFVASRTGGMLSNERNARASRCHTLNAFFDDENFCGIPSETGVGPFRVYASD